MENKNKICQSQAEIINICNSDDYAVNGYKILQITSIYEHIISNIKSSEDDKIYLVLENLNILGIKKFYSSIINKKIYITTNEHIGLISFFKNISKSSNIFIKNIKEDENEFSADFIFTEDIINNIDEGNMPIENVAKIFQDIIDKSKNVKEDMPVYTENMVTIKINILKTHNILNKIYEDFIFNTDNLLPVDIDGLCMNLKKELRNFYDTYQDILNNKNIPLYEEITSETSISNMEKYIDENIKPLLTNIKVFIDSYKYKKTAVLLVKIIYTAASFVRTISFARFNILAALAYAHITLYHNIYNILKDAKEIQDINQQLLTLLNDLYFTALFDKLSIGLSCFNEYQFKVCGNYLYDKNHINIYNSEYELKNTLQKYFVSYNHNCNITEESQDTFYLEFQKTHKLKSIKDNLISIYKQNKENILKNSLLNLTQIMFCETPLYTTPIVTTYIKEYLYKNNTNTNEKIVIFLTNSKNFTTTNATQIELKDKLNAEVNYISYNIGSEDYLRKYNLHDYQFYDIIFDKYKEETSKTYVMYFSAFKYINLNKIYDDFAKLHTILNNLCDLVIKNLKKYGQKIYSSHSVTGVHKGFILSNTIIYGEYKTKYKVLNQNVGNKNIQSIYTDIFEIQKKCNEIKSIYSQTKELVNKKLIESSKFLFKNNQTYIFKDEERYKIEDLANKLLKQVEYILDKYEFVIFNFPLSNAKDSNKFYKDYIELVKQSIEEYTKFVSNFSIPSANIDSFDYIPKDIRKSIINDIINRDLKQYITNQYVFFNVPQKNSLSYVIASNINQLSDVLRYNYIKILHTQLMLAIMPIYFNIYDDFFSFYNSKMEEITHNKKIFNDIVETFIKHYHFNETQKQYLYNIIDNYKILLLETAGYSQTIYANLHAYGKSIQEIENITDDLFCLFFISILYEDKYTLFIKEIYYWLTNQSQLIEPENQMLNSSIHAHIFYEYNITYKNNDDIRKYTSFITNFYKNYSSINNEAKNLYKLDASTINITNPMDNPAWNGYFLSNIREQYLPDIIDKINYSTKFIMPDTKKNKFKLNIDYNLFEYILIKILNIPNNETLSNYIGLYKYIYINDLALHPHCVINKYTVCTPIDIVNNMAIFDRHHIIFGDSKMDINAFINSYSLYANMKDNYYISTIFKERMYTLLTGYKIKNLDNVLLENRRQECEAILSYKKIIGKELSIDFQNFKNIINNEKLQKEYPALYNDDKRQNQFINYNFDASTYTIKPHLQVFYDKYNGMGAENTWNYIKQEYIKYNLSKDENKKLDLDISIIKLKLGLKDEEIENNTITKEISEEMYSTYTDKPIDTPATVVAKSFYHAVCYVEGYIPDDNLMPKKEAVVESLKDEEGKRNFTFTESLHEIAKQNLYSAYTIEDNKKDDETQFKDTIIRNQQPFIGIITLWVLPKNLAGEN